MKFKLYTQISRKMVHMFTKIMISLLLLSTVTATYNTCDVSEKSFYDIDLSCEANYTIVSFLPISQYYYHAGTDNPDTALLNQYRP